jgi:hypothetical protein
MEDVQLNYGGTTLTLKKSPTMADVKPNRASTQKVERTIARFGAEPLSQHLGEFLVIDVKGAYQLMEETLDAMRVYPSVVSGTHIYHTNDFLPRQKGCLNYCLQGLMKLSLILGQKTGNSQRNGQ